MKMWCGAKGIDCPDCGVFGECYRNSCSLPNAEPFKLGTSSINMTVVSTDELMEHWRDDPIQRKAMEEFVERLRVKEIERLKTKQNSITILQKVICAMLFTTKNLKNKSGTLTFEPKKDI